MTDDAAAERGTGCLTDGAAPTTDAVARAQSSRPEGDEGTGGVLSVRYRWITIGMCSLVLFAAFEAMAVTTVMPVIARQLHGEALYTLAFAGATAVSVIGMVIAGTWSDRRGPVKPLLLGVLLFLAGLAIAGLAPTMPALVAGRLVQGFGGGALTVALYVAVARWYPARLHPMVFVGFSTAWVLPSLIGPFVAGVVAEAFGWRWIFLGVIVVAVAGLMMIRRVVVGTPDLRPADTPPVPALRIAAAVVAAFAVLVLGGTAEIAAAWRWPIVAAAVVVLVLAIRPLLPKGTLRAASGLPSVMITRMLVNGAELACEVYVPYLLIQQYHLGPAIAGLAVSGGAVAWSAGSWLQGRLGPRRSNRGWVVLGTAAVVLGVGGTTVIAGLGLPAGWVFLVWVFTGLGMGLALPRLSVLMIGYSTPADQGFNSSAQAIADAVGAATGVALAGVVFASLSASGGAWPFAACLALGTLLAALALGAASRVGQVADEALVDAP